MFQARSMCFAGLALFAVVMSGAAFGSTVIVVDTLADAVADDGQCSLREAMINANDGNQNGSIDCSAGGGVEGTVIRFDLGLAGGSITLALGSGTARGLDSDLARRAGARQSGWIDA